METSVRRDKKHEIAHQMIITYCHGQKHKRSKNILCDECQELNDYSEFRTSKCPYVEKTLFCVNCPTPCYKPDMKERMRLMMKYSGPRFFFRHPIIVIDHVMYDYKTRKKDSK